MDAPPCASRRIFLEGRSPAAPGAGWSGTRAAGGWSGVGAGLGVEAAVGVAGAAPGDGAPPPDWQAAAKGPPRKDAADGRRAKVIERDFLTPASEDDDLSGQPHPGHALVPEAEEVRMKDF